MTDTAPEIASMRSPLAMTRADSAPARLPPPGLDEAALREAAVEFEAMFLAEMFSHTSLGRTPEGFGGGVGEDAFGSLLVREQARLFAERGGIGLAERIYQSFLSQETVE